MDGDTPVHGVGRTTGAPPMPARVLPLRAADPRRLGPYLLQGRLGQGGMGTVYLGRTGNGPWLAIKVIRDEYASDDEFRNRFRREAENARRVARFCTASVVDADPDGDPPYLVTEYVEGPTLSRAVATNGPLRSADLEQLAVNVATALTAIHNAGIVHRDLTPANVLLSPVGPKVIDFGVARATDLVTVAREAQRIGTPGFMAPEQASGAPVGAAADVFAWGGIVIYAGSGRLPFGEGATDAVLYRVIHEQPRLEGLDGTLRTLVQQAMRKDPATRPTAQELLMRLVGEPMAATVLGVPAPTPPPTPGAPAAAATSTPPAVGSAPPKANRTSRAERKAARAAAAGPASTPAPVPPSPARPNPVPPSPARPTPVAARRPAPTDPADPTTRIARSPVPAPRPESGARSVPPVATRPGADRSDEGEGGHRKRGVVLAGVLALVLTGAAVGIVVTRGSSGGGSTTPPPDLVAVSRRLAADATAVRGTNPALARRLSLAAYRAHDTAEADRALLASILPVTGTTVAMPTTRTLSVALRPDGGLLASAGSDRTVRLTTLSASGQSATAATVGGFGAAVTAVAFSSDGRTLAAADKDTTRLIDVSDLKHPRIVATLIGHVSPVEAVAFSPDGTMVATGSDDRTARLWNIRDRAHPAFIESLTGHYGPVTAVAFASTRHLAATAGIDGQTRIWNVTNPKSPVEVSSVMGDSGAINSVAFSPGGQLLATGVDDGTTRLLDLTDPANPRQVASVAAHDMRVTSVAFAGRLLLTGSLDGTVTVHDTADEQAPVLVATLPAVPGSVAAVAVSGDRSTVATGDGNRTAIVRSLSPARLATAACADPANRPDAALWTDYAPQVTHPPAAC